MRQATSAFLTRRRSSELREGATRMLRFAESLQPSERRRVALIVPDNLS